MLTLIQTDITPERKCSNDYYFSWAIFIFPIMFARVILRNKHKRVKAFFGCIIFLLSITKPNLLIKNDILKSTSEIFTYESIDTCNLLHSSHLHNAFAFFTIWNLSTEIKTPSLNCSLMKSVWIQDNILHFDRNRHGGGVACYVRND